MRRAEGSSAAAWWRSCRCCRGEVRSGQANRSDGAGQDEAHLDRHTLSGMFEREGGGLDGRGALPERG